MNTYLTRKLFRKLSGAGDFASDSKRLLYSHLVLWGSIMPYAVPARCPEQARFVGSYAHSAVVMRNPWSRIASAYWDKMEVMTLREKPCNELLESCCEHSPEQALHAQCMCHACALRESGSPSS